MCLAPSPTPCPKKTTTTKRRTLDCSDVSSSSRHVRRRRRPRRKSHQKTTTIHVSPSSTPPPSLPPPPTTTSPLVQQRRSHVGPGETARIMKSSASSSVPTRILGLDTETGRGFVATADQTSCQNRPEIVILDTPADHTLQLLCCKYILNPFTQRRHNKQDDEGAWPRCGHTVRERIVCNTVTTNYDDDNDVVVMMRTTPIAMELHFVVRFLSTKTNPSLKKRVEQAYLDGCHATYGILVLIPAMVGSHMGIKWGGRGIHNSRNRDEDTTPISTSLLDEWIETIIGGCSVN